MMKARTEAAPRPGRSLPSQGAAQREGESVDSFREATAPYAEGEVPGVPWMWCVPDGTWTWELFAALPEDGNRYEVIGGRLELSPPPKIAHQRVSVSLAGMLWAWAKRTQSGEVLTAPVAVVFADSGSYLEPDLIWIARERRSILASDQVRGAPDLVVEILSPGTARSDWADKKRVYERAGVPRYWVVDPDARYLMAFRLVDGRYQVERRVEAAGSFEPEGLPDLVISMNTLWE